MQSIAAPQIYFYY